MSMITAALIDGLERAIADTSDADFLVLRGPGYHYKIVNRPDILKKRLEQLKRNTRNFVKPTKPDGSPRIRL